MLKLRLQTARGPLVVLGLSHENLDRLKAGDPIHLDLSAFGINTSMFIYSGETEESMATDLVANGLVDAKLAATLLRDVAEGQEGDKSG